VYQTVIRSAPVLQMSCWDSPIWISLFVCNRPEEDFITKYTASTISWQYIELWYVSLFFCNICGCLYARAFVHTFVKAK
jgi:hypothetical protein